MSRNDPASARQQARPSHDPTDPRDNPQRSPGEATKGARPRAADTRSGATVYPEADHPDAASPTTAPHTVVGKEHPTESYDADKVAQKEIEAREAETGASPEREQGPARNAMMTDREQSRRSPLYYALIVLAVLVVLLLIFAL